MQGFLYCGMPRQLLPYASYSYWLKMPKATLLKKKIQNFGEDIDRSASVNIKSFFLH